MSSCNRNFSSIVVDGNDRAPNRSMLRAVGFEDEDFEKPQVAVCSAWSMVTPCNSHLDELGKASVEGVDGAGGKAVPFGTITVSDGISMGTPGMRYSLVSREVIADSIETVVGAEGMDGLVAIGGCDKNMPACVMALARMNRPGIFVYGGTILPVFTRKRISISYRYSKRSVPMHPARLMRRNSPISKRRQFPVRDPVVECTRPTPCPPPSRHLG